MSQIYQTRTGRAKYRVLRGDSLSKISEKVYGKREAWPMLARYNNINAPYHIQTGQWLKTPVLSPGLNFNSHNTKMRQPMNVVAQTAVPRTGLPVAQPPAMICAQISNEMLKKLFGNFLPDTIPVYGNCYKAEMSVEGSISIQRVGTAECVKVSHDSISMESEAKKQLGPYLEDIRNIAIEWDIPKRTVKLKPTAAMKMKTGKSEIEFGLDGELPAFLTGKSGARPGKTILSFYTQNKQSTEFVIGDLQYTLNLVIKLAISPDATKCQAPDLKVYRPRRVYVPDASLWDKPVVKVIVMGTAIVVMGALYLSGTGVLVTASAALFILLTGAVAPDSRSLTPNTL